MDRKTMNKLINKKGQHESTYEKNDESNYEQKAMNLLMKRKATNLLMNKKGRIYL